jgi:predicted RNA-binding Zn-ribbon protein involved in translation (DUF1610 family)
MNCPKCGSQNIEKFLKSVDGSSMTSFFECLRCGFESEKMGESKI